MVGINDWLLAIAVCADIDTSACQRLAVLKKDMCHDSCIMKTCPATCGKCCKLNDSFCVICICLKKKHIFSFIFIFLVLSIVLAECYSCPFVHMPNQCFTKTMCDPGEVCIVNNFFF